MALAFGLNTSCDSERRAKPAADSRSSVQADTGAICDECDVPSDLSVDVANDESEPDLPGELAPDLATEADQAADSWPSPEIVNDDVTDAEDLELVADVTSFEGVRVGLVADMRYFAAPDVCQAEFSVKATMPIMQEYVYLSSSSDSWPDSLDKGAVPLTLDGDRWTLTREYIVSENVEYKFLMKWPDTGQQWCNTNIDCGPATPNDAQFVDCDVLMRDTPNFFRGAAERLAELGPIDLVISPGDIDPPANVLWTLQRYLDPDVRWYPVAGNHETETPADIQWLRDFNSVWDPLPNIVSMGPPGGEETTYSFDVGRAHFVVINEYYNGYRDDAESGDISGALYDWLAADLAQTTQAHIFVVGHEPAYPLGDIDTGRVRHAEGSLNKNIANRDRFWSLLQAYGVKAYICGHTHSFSATEIDGVWQVDVGHARGVGDTGAPSTVAILELGNDGSIKLEAHRDNHDGVYDYRDLLYTFVLAP